MHAIRQEKIIRAKQVFVGYSLPHLQVVWQAVESGLLSAPRLCLVVSPLAACPGYRENKQEHLAQGTEVQAGLPPQRTDCYQQDFQDKSEAKLAKGCFEHNDPEAKCWLPCLATLLLVANKVHPVASTATGSDNHADLALKCPGDLQVSIAKMHRAMAALAEPVQPL